MEKLEKTWHLTRAHTPKSEMPISRKTTRLKLLPNVHVITTPINLDKFSMLPSVMGFPVCGFTKCCPCCLHY